MKNMKIAAWTPLKEEFAAWKIYTKSDHQTYEELKSHIEKTRQKFSNLVLLEMSIAEFDKILKEKGLPNTTVGRAGCSAAIIAETETGKEIKEIKLVEGSTPLLPT